MVPDPNLGRSDGHPVLILPGFAADDWSTMPLRRAVSNQGYWAHGWRLGRNVGPTARVVAGLRDRVEQLGRAHGRRVSVVGWSLGGVYARALARERPELVRQVISLGSPFRSFETSPAALAVPATSIYTRTDGVTSWQNCIDPTGTAGREHRGIRHAQRPRHQPGRDPRRARPPWPARGRLATLPATMVGPLLVSGAGDDEAEPYVPLGVTRPLPLTSCADERRLPHRSAATPGSVLAKSQRGAAPTRQGARASGLSRQPFTQPRAHLVDRWPHRTGRLNVSVRPVQPRTQGHVVARHARL